MASDAAEPLARQALDLAKNALLVNLRFMNAAFARLPAGTRVLVGTGETPSTLSFYAQCGFRPAGRIPDFFTRNYDHPIVEEGVLLRDMILLEQPLGTE